MRELWKTVCVFAFLAILLLAPAGRAQAKITVTADFSNNKVNFATDNLTFYFWYGPPQAEVYINPTFAWIDNKESSIMYVADLLGLYEFSEQNSIHPDFAFQRNETAVNGTFSWVGNERWSTNNVTYTQVSPPYNILNMTLNAITNPAANRFTYLPGNLTLRPTNYGDVVPLKKFFGYEYTASQARTDVFFNMTQPWKWVANSTTSNLAMMLGFYTLNTTVIQQLGINLQDYMVPNYDFLSPETLIRQLSSFNPNAFALSGMHITANNGATTPGGHFNLSQNETALYPAVYEHCLDYTLPSNSSTSMPFVRIQFDEGNQTLPGYFSFPGFAVGLDSAGAKKNILSVGSSWISTGNYLRLFLSYPYFGTDQLRHFFSFGVDDKYLPIPPTSPGVYVLLPGLTGTEALVIAGGAVAAIVVSFFSTRYVHRAGIEGKK